MADEEIETSETTETEAPRIGTAEFRAAQRLARDLKSSAAKMRKALGKMAKHPLVKGAFKGELAATLDVLRGLESEAAAIVTMSKTVIGNVGSVDDPEALEFAEGYRDYARGIAATLDWVTVPDDALVLPSAQGDGAYVESFLWIDAEDVEDDEDLDDEDEDEDDFDDEDEDEDDLDFDEDDEDDEDEDDEDEDEDE